VLHNEFGLSFILGIRAAELVAVLTVELSDTVDILESLQFCCEVIVHLQNVFMVEYLGRVLVIFVQTEFNVFY